MATLAEKAAAANYLQTGYRVSVRSACRLLSIHRNSKRAYAGKSSESERDQRVIELSLSETHWDYRKVYDRLAPEYHASPIIYSIVRPIGFVRAYQIQMKGASCFLIFINPSIDRFIRDKLFACI